MTSSTTAHNGQHESPQIDYDAKEKDYESLLNAATARNKAAVFDALAKAGISVVTIAFDGYGDSGQVEDIQATVQDAPVALPSDQIEYEHIRWGETEPSRSSCSLRHALEDLAFHYLGTAHGGWENDDGAFGEFTFDTATCSITLAYNERFTDSISSEHEF